LTLVDGKSSAYICISDLTDSFNLQLFDRRVILISTTTFPCFTLADPGGHMES